MTKNLKEILVFCAGLIVCIGLYKLFGFHYAFNHDTWHFNYANCRIIQEQITAGHFPFWNKYNALGSPLIFTGSIDLIFIPLLYLLSVMDYIAITGFICLFAGIYFMYKFLEGEGFTPILSLTGSIVWNFNGLFLWHLHEHVYHEVLGVTPLVLLLIRNIHRKAYPFISWILMIIANMVQLSTGRWECYEYSVLIAFLYIFVVIKCENSKLKASLSKKIKLVALYVSSIILSFTLIAPFSFSYIEIIQNTFRSAMIPTQYYSIWDILNIFLPNQTAFGSVFYTSLIILPFIFVALFKVDRIRLFAIILICLYFALAYPSGLFDVMRKLPMHGGQVIVKRTFLVFYLGLSILFVYGIRDYIFRNDRRYDRILLVCIVLFLLMFLGVSVTKLYFNRPTMLVYPHHLSAILLCVVVWGSLAVWKGKISSNKLKLWLPICIIVYTVFFATMFNKNDRNDGDLRRLKSKFLNELETSYVAKIKELNKKEPLDYRVVFRKGFHPSFHAANLLESINIYGPLPSYSLGMISTRVLGNQNCYNCILDLPESNVFYSLSSVKYVVSKVNQNYAKQNNSSNMIYYDGNVEIVENLDVFERIRFIDHFIIIDSFEDSVEFIAKTPLDWFRTKCIINESPEIRGNSKEGIPTYKILTNTPGQIKLYVASPKETMMILNNAYNKGWKLNVNGETKPIYRVNAYFQGIKIVQGTNVYDLYYLPANFLVYLIISITTCCIIGFISIVYWRSKKIILKNDKIPRSE